MGIFVHSQYIPKKMQELNIQKKAIKQKCSKKQTQYLSNII